MNYDAISVKIDHCCSTRPTQTQHDQIIVSTNLGSNNRSPSPVLQFVFCDATIRTTRPHNSTGRPAAVVYISLDPQQRHHHAPVIKTRFESLAEIWPVILAPPVN